MVPDWLARAVAARQAPAVGVALLALAAFGQALAHFAVAAGQDAIAGSVQAVFGPIPTCLFAVAAAVSLLLRRPAAAVVAVTAANVVLLAWFGEATVAGVIAQLIAAYRAGAAGAPRAVRGAGTAGSPGWAVARTSSGADAVRQADPGSVAGAGSVGDVIRLSGSGSVADAARLGGAELASWLSRVPGARRAHALGTAATPYLGIALALPFLALALAGRGGAAAMMLAWGGPAAAGTGIAVRARRETRTRTAAGEALADTMLAHTARGERARIARELHDVVAHHISMVSVQAETARLTTPGLPAAGAQRFAEIGDTARAGLTEMRRLLGVLREDAADAGATLADRHPQPGLRQLAELVDAARDAAGTAARLIVSGPVAEFDPGVELAAYRIVQEALTNVRRHAPGAAVDVELRYADDALLLLVRDNGPGPAGLPDGSANGCATAGENDDGQVTTGPTPGAPGRVPAGTPGGGNGSGPPADGGHGLVGVRERATAAAAVAPAGPAPAYGGHGLLGMRERALAVGGELRTGAAAGGGFLVEALLPAKPDAAVVRLATKSARAETGT
jgi:signal transduction histidine kinase